MLLALSIRGQPWRHGGLVCSSMHAVVSWCHLQATEKVEEAAHMQLLRQHKLLAVQYKGVAGEQR